MVYKIKNMAEKFKYVMNALHYCIYKEEVWSNKKIGTIVSHLMFFVYKYCFTKRMRLRFYQRHLQSQKEIDEYMYGKKYGQSIGMTHHIFGTFYSCYSACFSWIFLGIANRKCRELESVVALLIITIPIAIGYIPIYKTVFSNDIYLKYYKQFEKKDNYWHKKWKWITTVFCIGGILITVIGFCCMAIISSI